MADIPGLVAGQKENWAVAGRSCIGNTLMMCERMKVGRASSNAATIVTVLIYSWQGIHRIIMSKPVHVSKGGPDIFASAVKPHKVQNCQIIVSKQDPKDYVSNPHVK